MRPAIQPQQRSYRQEGWPSETPHVTAIPTPFAASLHADPGYVPLSTAAPALPPYYQRSDPAFFPNSSSCSTSPYPPFAASASNLPTPQSRGLTTNVPSNMRPHLPSHNPSGQPSRPPLSPRLTNPFEQQAHFMTPNDSSFSHDSMRNSAARPLSYGPGDPLFSGTRSSSSYSASHFSPNEQSPWSSPINSSSQEQLTSMYAALSVHRTTSSSSEYADASRRPARNDTSNVSHGAPGHEYDNCPGCRAEMDDAIKASVQSAQQEEELRLRRLQEQQELDRAYAMTAEEEQRQRRLAQEEEQILQQAIEDSRREAEMQSQRYTQDEQILVERSRQGSSSPTPHPHSRSPSIPERGSSYNTPTSKRLSSSSSYLAPDQRGQRALAGLDFGYCDLPFAPKLDKSHLPSAQSAPSAVSTATSSSSIKTLFPASIELSSTSTANSQSIAPCAGYFVLRAYSWKSLLRAIAWYGNSRVEAAPEEVAFASDRRMGRCLLRAEVEFVTPTRIDHGVGSMSKSPSPAHVALCLSLLPVPPSSSREASAPLMSKENHDIKRESRRLDAWYAGRGSTRRLIQLARQPPALPVALVEVAQLLHASHTLSAACPSSSSTARHSPRDLHHAIERHDEGFVRKQKAVLSAGPSGAPHTGDAGLTSNASLGSSDPRLSMAEARHSSSSIELHQEANSDDDVDDEDQEIDINDFNLDLAADGSFDAQDKVLMGKRQRLKAKVKRRLAKRGSDGRVVDEDLATWITPFDLSQHG